jgi:ribosome-binding protein aMBF1 (putative translation factor)
MSQNFYEMLKVGQGASSEEIRSAFQNRTAQLVRRLRTAQQRGADTSSLESQERALKEAMEVLCDPRRRKSYDVFRKMADGTVPDSMQKLWELAKPAIVDGRVASGVHLLAKSTQLPFEQLTLLPQEHVLSQEDMVTSPRIEPMPNVKRRKERPAETTAPKAQVKVQTRRLRASNSPPSLKRGKESLRRQAQRKAQQALQQDRLEELVEKFGYDGRFIREVRKLRGMSLQDLSSVTMISMEYLKAIERNAFEQLPSAIFVTGYIRNIAQALKIADRPIAEEFMALFQKR